MKAAAADEVWRPVRSFDGYEVSNRGRVRALPGGRRRPGIKTPTLDHDGYIVMSFGARSQTRRVHVLVARAFLGEPSPGQEVRHLDGNRADPSLDNLAYGTRSENNCDAVAHGTHAQAAKRTCPAGHDYSPENTYVYRGRRNCRTCTREHKNARRAAAR